MASIKAANAQLRGTQRLRQVDIKAVIFDCDGTLVDTEALYHEAYNFARKLHGATAGVGTAEYGRTCSGNHVDVLSARTVKEAGLSCSPDTLTKDWFDHFHVLLEKPGAIRLCE